MKARPRSKGVEMNVYRRFEGNFFGRQLGGLDEIVMSGAKMDAVGLVTKCDRPGGVLIEAATRRDLVIIKLILPSANRWTTLKTPVSPRR